MVYISPLTLKTMWRRMKNDFEREISDVREGENVVFIYRDMSERARGRKGQNRSKRGHPSEISYGLGVKV